MTGYRRLNQPFGLAHIPNFALRKPDYWTLNALPRSLSPVIPPCLRFLRPIRGILTRWRGIFEWFPKRALAWSGLFPRRYSLRARYETTFPSVSPTSPPHPALRATLSPKGPQGGEGRKIGLILPSPPLGVRGVGLVENGKVIS